MPVEIYHLKAAGKRNWDKAAQAIAKIDSARAAGQDVGADMYPYTAGGTGLAACLPPWASADGKLYGEPGATPRCARAIRDGGLAPSARRLGEPAAQLATPEGYRCSATSSARRTEVLGQALCEIAGRPEGKHWVDALMDLTAGRERRRIGTIYFMMSEENVELQLRQPWIKFGTDAGGERPRHARAETHPRAYGTFPRILGSTCGRAVLPLEDAVRKMTSRSPSGSRFATAGSLREGMYADVVVFDPATVIDNATWSTRTRSAAASWTSASMASRSCWMASTGAKPGKAVRGPGWRRN